VDGLAVVASITALAFEVDLSSAEEEEGDFAPCVVDELPMAVLPEEFELMVPHGSVIPLSGDEGAVVVPTVHVDNLIVLYYLHC